MMRHSGFLWLHVTVLFDLVLAQLFEIAENKNRSHTHTGPCGFVAWMFGHTHMASWLSRSLDNHAMPPKLGLPALHAVALQALSRECKLVVIPSLLY